VIDQTGHARLADFGLLTIISDPANLLSSSSHIQGGTIRWMGPELIAPQDFGFKNSRPTKPSDCYSLGMVIYETISGNIPFHEHTDLTVSVKVLRGERPSRGARFTENLWGMLEQCWASQPNNRPSVEGVLRCLETSSILPEPSSPGVDEGMESDSGSEGTFDRNSSAPSNGLLDQASKSCWRGSSVSAYSNSQHYPFSLPTRSPTFDFTQRSTTLLPADESWHTLSSVPSEVSPGSTFCPTSVFRLLLPFALFVLMNSTFLGSFTTPLRRSRKRILRICHLISVASPTRRYGNLHGASLHSILPLPTTGPAQTSVVHGHRDPSLSPPRFPSPAPR